MRYAVFSSTDLGTEGGWEDLVHQGSLDECLSHPLGDGDWAHIIDLETGDWVHAKRRVSHDRRINDEPWFAVPGKSVPIDDRLPVLWRLQLSWDQTRKLSRLGGEAWLKAQIESAELPPGLLPSSQQGHS